ncbi:predicted protein, partial [Arabidopsis lyrata subsp. lyrata]
RGRKKHKIIEPKETKGNGGREEDIIIVESEREREGEILEEEGATKSSCKLYRQHRAFTAMQVIHQKIRSENRDFLFFQ